MGSPTIFSGRYTKLLTNKGILNSDGSLNQNDGPINYVKYAEFEQNVTTGWSLGTTGTLTNAIPTGTPTFGSGASGNLSIATSNVSPIRDNFSLRYVSSAATTAGNMLATDALTIDAADQAKVLTYKFYYSVVSGATTANFSGTSSNSFGVAIWDVTNSAWIGVAGNFSMTQNSGVGIASGTFQTNSNTSQIRLVIYNANATSGAITLAFDDFFVGPQTAPIGPVVTDWVSYTPTWTGLTVGNANQRFFYRRNGDSVEIKGNIQFGSTTSVSGKVTFTLPAGLSLDNSKNPYPLTAAGFSRLGTASVYDGGVKSILMVIQDSTSLNTLYFVGKDGTTVIDPLNNTSYAWGANDEIEVIELTVPISGWSSNVQLSNDTDTRVIASSYYGSAFTTTTNAAIPFNFINFDQSASVTLATGRFTAPVTGFYHVLLNGWYRTSGAGSSLFIWKNGNLWSGLLTFQATNTYYAGSIIIQLNAGDYIDFRTDGAVPLGSGYNVSISRASGPSVVAASETVAARFTDSSGQALSANTLVKFGTKDFDSHNAYSSSTGLFTVPVSGKYSIKAGLQMSASVTLSTAQGFYMSVVKNGSTYGQLGQVIGSGVAHTHFICGSDDIICNAGDTIALYAGASVNINLNTTATANHLSIVRVGN